jgi:hypothetical protein
MHHIVSCITWLSTASSHFTQYLQLLLSCAVTRARMSTNPTLKIERLYVLLLSMDMAGPSKYLHSIQLSLCAS